MIVLESKRLVEFSETVRESTLKKLHTVPNGFENWRISINAMSISDLTHHLIECDIWLFKKLKLKRLNPIWGKAGECEISDRYEYLKLIDKLFDTGKIRSELIQSCTEKDFQEKIIDERFGKEVSTWWIIVRGNLDHEIHHRGQIASYLRVIKDMRK